MSSRWTTVTASSDTSSSLPAGSSPSRLSARPVGLGATASQVAGCVLVRYCRYRALHATEAEVASFRAIADGATCHGLVVVDHLVVVS